MQEDNEPSKSSAEPKSDRFADWDLPAKSAMELTANATDPKSQSPSASAPAKLFLDSPVYSIDNYRKLAFIKNTFVMVNFLNILFGGLGAFLLFIFYMKYFYMNRRLPSSEILYIVITVILSNISVIWAVYQFLPKRRRTRPILVYSIIAYSVYAFTFLIIFIIDEMSGYVSDDDIAVIIIFLTSLVLLVSYLRHRLSTYDDYLVEMQRDGMDISREELQRTLSTIITDSERSFWRINLSNTPGSLSDKLENTLLSQLYKNKSISEPALIKMKESSFLNSFNYFLKYPRFIVIYSIFSVTFYIAAISILARFYDLEDVYRKFYGYGYSNYYEVPLYLNEEFIPFELIIFQIVYFTVIAMLRRRPIAALYAYRINNLIFCFLVLALQLFVFLLPNQGFKKFMSTNEILFFFLSIPIAAFLPIALSYRYVRQFPKAFKAIIESGVSPLYYDLRLVRDAYLMIAGYQRHVENADEDGWE